jgi:5-methylcytosine-specific restriction endonuclease McrA
MSNRRRFNNDELEAIFDRTRGKCHICHARLSLRNYGQQRTRGAWHVDHSIPLARGGSNHGNNLYAACISCNCGKSATSSRTARRRNGTKRAPMNSERYAAARADGVVGGGAIGAGIGAMFGGPPGALIGGLIGAAIGGSSELDE